MSKKIKELKKDIIKVVLEKDIIKVVLDFFYYSFVLFSIPFVVGFLMSFFPSKTNLFLSIFFSGESGYSNLFILFLLILFVLGVLKLVKRYHYKKSFFIASGVVGIVFYFLNSYCLAALFGSVLVFWIIYIIRCFILWLILWLMSLIKKFVLWIIKKIKGNSDDKGIKLLSDKPLSDKPWEEDEKNLLWDKYEIVSFANIVSTNVAQKDNFVFGIEGQRGNGKTSFWNLTKNELTNNIEVIDFQPWFLDNQANLLRKFLEVFSEKIGNDHDIPQIKRHINDLWSLLDDIDTNIAIGPIKLAGRIKAKENFTTISKNIENCLNKISGNILIVVDDLDRLPMSKVMEMLKVVQICQRIEGLNFVLIYDPENFNKIDVNLKNRDYSYEDDDKSDMQMKESLNNENIKHYIEKIVNVTYPCYYSDEKLIEFAGKQLDKYTKNKEDEENTIKKILSSDQKSEILSGLQKVIKEFRPYRYRKKYNINPRFIKRLINSLILTFNELYEKASFFDKLGESNNYNNGVFVETLFYKFDIEFFIKLKILFLYEKKGFDILKKETEKQNDTIGFIGGNSEYNINLFLIEFDKSLSISIKSNINNVVDDIIGSENVLYDLKNKVNKLNKLNKENTLNKRYPKYKISKINENIQQHLFLISNHYGDLFHILLDMIIELYANDRYKDFNSDIINKFIIELNHILIESDKYKYIEILNFKINEIESNDNEEESKEKIIERYLYRKLIEGLIDNIEKDYKNDKASQEFTKCDIESIKEIIKFIITESKSKQVDGSWIGVKISDIIGIKDIKKEINLKKDIFEILKNSFGLLESLYIIHWLKTMLLDRKMSSWNKDDLTDFYERFYDVYESHIGRILNSINEIDKLENDNFWEELSKYGLFMRLARLLFAYPESRDKFINEFFEDEKIQEDYIEYFLWLILDGFHTKPFSTAIEFIEKNHFEHRELLIKRLKKNKKNNEKIIEDRLLENDYKYYLSPRAIGQEKRIYLKKGWKYLKNNGYLF